MTPDVLGLLAQAQDGVYAVDMNQRVILWNPAAERILGYRAEEVLGKRCYQVFGIAPEGETKVCASNCAVILWARRGQIAPSHIIPSRTRSGESKWISVTHVLLPAQRRELSTLVHIFHEITEQIEAKRLIGRLEGLLSNAPPIGTSSRLAALEAATGSEELTPREREILQLLARGLSTKAIAEKLVISTTTVRNHIQRILAKLGVHTRLEAVAAASRHLPL